MESKGTDKSPRSRKPYEKPRVEAVELKAGEAVLSNCKAVDGFFNALFGNACNAVFQCNNVGS